MVSNQVRAGRYAGIALAVLLASFGVSSCGGEEGDPADPAGPDQIQPGARPALNPASCAAVARGGKVGICHVSEGQGLPESALTVPTEVCGSLHAGHANDFLADEDGGCGLHEKRVCVGAGKSCKLGGTPCCVGGCICQGKKCRC